MRDTFGKNTTHTLRYIWRLSAPISIDNILGVCHSRSASKKAVRCSIRALRLGCAKIARLVGWNRNNLGSAQGFFHHPVYTCMCCNLSRNDMHGTRQCLAVEHPTSVPTTPESLLTQRSRERPWGTHDLPPPTSVPRFSFSVHTSDGQVADAKSYSTQTSSGSYSRSSRLYGQMMDREASQ